MYVKKQCDNYCIRLGCCKSNSLKYTNALKTNLNINNQIYYVIYYTV